MKRGFTLIEVLLYIALYAMLMAGALSAVYGLLQSSDHNTASARVEEEGDFLIGKIEWALSDARTVDQPVRSGNELTVVRADGSAVSFWNSGADLRIQENNGLVETLNDSDVAITDLSFVHAINGASQSIEASFIVHATTSRGLPLSRTFSTLEYLRQ